MADQLREPADRDRLFAVSILKYGRLDAMRESGDWLRKLNPEQRESLANDLVAAPARDDEKEQWARELILTCLSELEAFDVIERVLRLTARAPSKGRTARRGERSS